MTKENTTIKAFIEAEKLEMNVSLAARNPYMDKQLPRNFYCTIRQAGRGNPRSMHVYFSQGSAHTNAPTLAEALDCLASDAAGVEHARSFEEWAEEYGYDTDSRKAEKTYRLCVDQASELRALLGHDAYEMLLYHTERL